MERPSRNRAGFARRFTWKTDNLGVRRTPALQEIPFGGASSQACESEYGTRSSYQCCLIRFPLPHGTDVSVRASRGCRRRLLAPGLRQVVPAEFPCRGREHPDLLRGCWTTLRFRLSCFRNADECW